MNRFVRIGSVTVLLAVAVGCREAIREPAPPTRAENRAPAAPESPAPAPESLEIQRGEAPLADPRRDTTVLAVEKAMPSVVNIATTELRQVDDPIQAWFRVARGERPFDKRTSIGSGVIIGEEGYVLTVDHVVRHASEIWVKLADGRERVAERIAWVGRADIALLRIKAQPDEKFTPIRIAGDDDVLLGETVLSLGNPYGLGGSVSRGILSSKNRRPPSETERLRTGDWLQTDAAMNFGSSGGALINLRGELIGLNVAVQPDAQGIGFAIPIRAVTDSVSGALTPELARGLWFGAQLKPRRGAEAEQGGVIVSGVESDSPAAKAGVRADDVIVAINGVRPRSYVGFAVELLKPDAPRDAALTVKRDGRDTKLTVRMIELASIFHADLVRERTGATVVAMTVEMARRIQLAQPEGLVVQSIEPDSPAAAAGLQPGSIIVRHNDRRAESVVEFARFIRSLKKGETFGLYFVNLRGQPPLLSREDFNARLTVR